MGDNVALLIILHDDGSGDAYCSGCGHWHDEWFHDKCQGCGKPIAEQIVKFDLDAKPVVLSQPDGYSEEVK